MANNRNKKAKDATTPSSTSQAAHPPLQSVWGKNNNPLTTATTTAATATPAQTATNTSNSTAAATPISSTSLPSVKQNGVAESVDAGHSMGVFRPSPASIHYVLGSMVRVTNSLNEVIEGMVYLYDASTHVLALEVGSKGESKDYSMLNTMTLSSVELVSGPSPSSIPQSYPHADPVKLANKEKRLISERQQEAKKIGIGVTPEAQRIFDVLAKTLPARWEGSTIVLVESLRLSPPYTTASLTGGSAQQQQRIRVIIEAERNKMK